MHPGFTDTGGSAVSRRHYLACAGLVLAALAGLASAAAPAPPPSLPDCDSDAFASVLLAAPAGDRSAPPIEARAYWLNRQLLKWPGTGASGVFRIYYSANGQLAISNGALSGAAGSLKLDRYVGSIPAVAAERFKYVADGIVLRVADADLARLPDLHRGELLLVQEDRRGTLQQATALQLAGALDDLYAPAAEIPDLGVAIDHAGTRFKLWAPTARNVALCLYGSGTGKALALVPMQRDQATGAWSASQIQDLSGKYYRYLVDVFGSASVVMGPSTGTHSTCP